MASSNIITCSNGEFTAKLAKLRDQSLKPIEVRELAGELTQLLVKDAIQAPAAGEKVAVIVILRSGMAMSDAFAAGFPRDTDMVIYHLGLFRDKTSLQPVEYYNKMPPKDPRITHAYIIDPLIATGGTISAAISIVKDWGVGKITVVSLLASESGIKSAASVWPESTRLVTGAIDPHIDSRGYVKPGLGDIGDRLFGTNLK